MMVCWATHHLHGRSFEFMSDIDWVQSIPTVQNTITKQVHICKLLPRLTKPIDPAQLPGGTVPGPQPHESACWCTGWQLQGSLQKMDQACPLINFDGRAFIGWCKDPHRTWTVCFISVLRSLDCIFSMSLLKNLNRYWTASEQPKQHPLTGHAWPSAKLLQPLQRKED
jgi:hypothetical protein